MKDHYFKLTREDLARQIHQGIREVYPDLIFEGNIVHEMLIVEEPAGSGFIFPAGDFAAACDLGRGDFVGKLRMELGIEFEKNLHDKFLFDMKMDGELIYFRPIKSEFENDR
jgi:hypothetical protein